MPTYQRAYFLRNLRQFSEWNEDKYLLPASRDRQPEGTPRRDALKDDSIVFLHEDLVVTTSCWDRASVLWDDLTPAWQVFCKDVLNFEIPDWEEESRQVREGLKAVQSDPSSVPIGEDDGGRSMRRQN